MNLPEFTAQASLYRTSNSYRSLAFDRASPQRTVLVPQLGGPGFQGLQSCINDCRDENRDFTIAECRAFCGGSDIGTPSDPGTTLFSDSLCYVTYAGCSLNPLFPQLLCDAVLKNCLETNRRS
jgi:hypothetical protein